MKSNKLNAVTSIFILALFVLGCVCGRGSNTQPPKDYIGAWKGRDGSSLVVRPDGSADFKQGGTSFTNASVTISNNSLQLSFFGFTVKELRIDQPPMGGRMTLDGILYIKSDFGSDDFERDSEGSSFNLNRNSEESLNPTRPKADKYESNWDQTNLSTSQYDFLIRQTLLDFNESVQAEDFSEFHSNCSTPFRQQFTRNDLNSRFRDFIVSKEQVDQIMQQVSFSPISYTQTPRIRKEQGYDILSASGSFNTQPSKVFFDLEFIREDDWRILKIAVQLR